MKKTYTLIATVLIFIIYLLPNFVIAQSPEKMSYQAIIRESNNDLVIDSSVGMQLSILQGTETGTSVYTETHTTTTNINGLVTIEIGTGTTSDDMSAIDWGSGLYFIKTETDPAGGTNYTITGTSQLLSVPYALYAKTAKSVEEIDPLFNLSVASDITTGDTTRWGKAELPTGADGNIITYDGNNWIAKDLILTSSNTGGGVAINNIQPSLALNYCICLFGVFPSRSSSEPFIGEIQLFGFNFAPRNFATCSGQLLSISQNTALFSLLGTTYGGDGRTTFGLPDLRGRSPISFGQGPGLTNRRIGERIGAETTVISIANLPAHQHKVNISFED